MDVSVPGAASLRLFWSNLDTVYGQEKDAIHDIASASEQERANRYHRDMDRRRFLASRFLLRQILGKFVGKKGHDLQFKITEFGKPVLLDDGVHFNLSHSGQYFALAIHAGAPVGVDVESRMTPETAVEVSTRILSVCEYKWWSALPPEKMTSSLTRFWTLKEAILKAYGKGFSQDPREIELNLGGAAPEIIRLPEAFGDIRNCRLLEIVPNGFFPAVSMALVF